MLENKTILSLSYGKIIVKSSPDSGLVPAEYSGYQLLSPGDIVIRCTDLQNDQKSQRIGFVEVGGIITSAYLGLKVNDGINSRYIAYWLKKWDATKEIYRYGSGLRQSLSWVDLKYLPIPLPPLSEQKAIVKYLDAETGRIDKAIAAEEKMIALLQERREIVINEAVGGQCGSEGVGSGGVDFHTEARCARDEVVRLPERSEPEGPQGAARRRGWEVKKLFYMFEGFGSGTTPRVTTGGGNVPWVNSGDLNYSYLTSVGKFVDEFTLKSNTALRLYPKDSIIIAMYGASIGKVSISKIDETGWLIDGPCRL